MLRSGLKRGALQPYLPTWGHTKQGCVRPVHSQAEWDRIIVVCGFRCFYCAAVLLPSAVVKDHLVPQIHNGCNCCGNIVPSCNRCNCMKRDKTVYEFLQMKPALVETTGRFYTSITALKPLCDPSSDPLLKEIVRIANRHRFPSAGGPSHSHSYGDQRPTMAWRRMA